MNREICQRSNGATQRRPPFMCVSFLIVSALSIDYILLKMIPKIQAIRETGATNKILVPGNGYTGAHSWYATYYGSANAIVMLNITDPGNNMVYEVHQYLDGDSSGTDQSGTCVSTTIGAERLTEFTNWLKTNNKKGFLGEFAGGNNAQCGTAIEGAWRHSCSASLRKKFSF